jgi:hypothetical protein
MKAFAVDGSDDSLSSLTKDPSYWFVPDIVPSKVDLSRLGLRRP